MDSKRRSRKRRTEGVSRGLNTMLLRTSWSSGVLGTGTTGTMSSWTAPSIANCSEYSVVQSLFTEVRLIRATFIFTPTQAANGTVSHGALVIGTNMLENQTTGQNPTGYIDVQNTTHPVRISSLSVRPLTYNMSIPGGLEYASITADAPDPATPWAGSPGVVKWYGAGFTASTIYFQLHLEAVYALRGRQ